MKKDTEFTNLAPIDNIENGEEYLNTLHWAIKQKNVKNIALAGPYGSGKSSIIETYLKKHKIIKWKTLRISMATFIENQTDEEGNPKRILLDRDEIELGILKQLFYKVNYKKIPQSRYRKLHKINWKKIWAYLILGVSILIVLCWIFYPDVLQSIIEKIQEAGEKIKLEKHISIRIFIVFCIAMCAVIARIYRAVLFRFKVDEVKLPADTVVKNTETTTETVFNKNMDEIVYFFEETKYRIVFFEDLDRLENPSIFIHLRELNTLLNNYDGIKDRIVFVYAIRDDIFTDTDRTKFFDFIVPVIPIINSTNSGEIFLQKIEKAGDKEITHKISQEFILDVAPYVEDMRILQNIYNEFVLYKKVILIDQELKLSDENMMALIIFKNLYPRDFANLQTERGIVKQAFIDKQNYIVRQCAEWKDRINENTDRLENYNDDRLNEINELKTAMFGAMVNWQGIPYRINESYYKEYDVKKIMEDIFDLSKLERLKKVVIYYYTWDGRTADISIDDFQKIFKLYYERIINLKIVQEKTVVSMKAEIEELKKKVHELSGWSLKKLIEKFGVCDVLSEKVRENKVLVFMLRRGYIDEKYANYINYFKGTSITREDMNFILAIKNMERMPYNYNLTKVDRVIQHLQVYEFEQKSVLNFILLEELLSKEVELEKRDALITQLSDETEECWNFINEFIEQTHYKEKLTRLLAMKWSNMWSYIAEKVSLTYERKLFYLRLLIDNVEIEKLIALNSDCEVNRFVEENPDILQQLSNISDEKVIALIENLEIVFTNISIDGVSEKVLRCIFEDQHYQLNSMMIRRIVEFINESMVAGLDTQNYTVATALGYAPLIKYIQENLKDYVEAIVLAKANTKESKEQVIDLLERSVEDSELCLKIINHEEFCLDDISICCGSFGVELNKQVKKLWDELLEKNKVKVKWENIKCYWDRYGLTAELIRYLEISSQKLEYLDNQCIGEEFTKAIITSSIDNAVLEKLLQKLELKAFDIPMNNITEKKIQILIRKKYIPFNIDMYDELEVTYPSLCVDFILYNQEEYRKLIENISMSETLLEALFSSPRLDSSMARILLETFGEDYMSTDLAQCLLNINVDISKSLFYLAWEKLPLKEEKNKLMIKYRFILGISDFRDCFQGLSPQYMGFCNRSKKHSVELEDTDENRRLAERLKEISYITSYSIKEKTDFDPVKGIEKRKSILLCWVKAVKA